MKQQVKQLFVLLEPVPWRSIGATIPLVVWIRDSFFNIYRVKGSSMEPTLQNNDIVIVRKCDWGIITQSICERIQHHFSRFNNYSFYGTCDIQNYDDHGTTNIPSEDNSKKNSNNTSSSDVENEKERIVRYEWMMLNNNNNNNNRNDSSVLTPQYRSWLYEAPVLALSGHVIVFRHPNSSPYYGHQQHGSNRSTDELCIKRIIGMGGQWVSIRPTMVNVHSEQENSENNNTTTNRYKQRTWQSLPVYTFYVEGDNSTTSVRMDDPISKHLLVGIAEYIVWPPSRWGTRLTRRTSIPASEDEINSSYDQSIVHQTTMARWM
jgi:signal peptidase I